MSSILTDIVKMRRDTIAQAKKLDPLSDIMQNKFYHSRQPFDVYKILAQAKSPAIIAEFKRKSPSQGALSHLGAEQVATEYVDSGATMVSVLTEPSYFNGSLHDLSTIRKACPTIPILMKDFVIDCYQVHLAKAIGADCILLIIGMISLEENQALLTLAHSLGLGVLVETHNEQDIQAALQLNPRLIGINSRNLKTMATDLEQLYALRKLIPENLPVVAESGIQTGADIKQLLSYKFNSFLVGTSLMRSHTPGAALAKMIKEAMT